MLNALDDDDERVLAAAAEALGRLSDPRAVEPLLPLLGDQRMFRLRRNAFEWPEYINRIFTF